MKIAVIITAYNRKEKTLKSIEKLYQITHHEIEITIYLTDDGSTDGTSDAIKDRFPDVIISHGNGDLYWAGGMNLSWKKAIEDEDYDGYLWLNDDTEILSNLWLELLEADAFSKKEFRCGGIYLGPTKDKLTNRLTYGGSIQISKWRSKFKMLTPNGKFQLCDVGNGNITYISKNVVQKIGCLYPGYTHGADYDYTYWAHKEGFPLILLKQYVGYCQNDHKTHRSNLLKRNVIQRIKYLFAPTGMQLSTAALFQKRFFPHYVPLLYISYWFKALFPWIIKDK